MRKPVLVFMAVTLIFLNACGKVTATKNFSAPTAGPISETEALNTLNSVPLGDIRAIRPSGKPKVNAAELTALIQKLIAEGKVKLPSGIRTATATGGVDLSQLTNIFTLLQNGGIANIFQLAQGLFKMSGSATTGGGLDNLLAILQAVAPVIAIIAPQFSPIILALTTIVPLVITFIKMFQKPSAAIIYFQPVRV